uniref:Putative E3 ubiquitin-protein ligase RING1a n=1 Tax=Phallusia mammillata TaxID=59560 RepID=A0A6F9DW85_9ASCI|nr:putative E3 ubiquitin-protein ligase RING1a [Phallusia mammillata]
MASGSVLQSKLREDLLTCPICCSQYVEPKVLKCQHSFCCRCLKGCLKAGAMGKRSVKCAVCRKSTTLTKKGVNDIPSNYVILGLMQMLKDHKDAPAKSRPTKSEKPVKTQQKASKPATAGLSKVVQKAVKAGKAKDRNDNKRMTKRKVESDSEDDDTESAESDSETSESSSLDEFTPADDTSTAESDMTSSLSDSDDDEDSSDDEADDDAVPDTPTMKSSQGIKKGMKICVFNKKGKPFQGTVRVLERVKHKTPGQARVYAGIELEKENSRLNTPDLDDMEDTYLYNWLMDYDFPCAVVRVDQCCPSKLLSDLLPVRK